MDALKLNDGPVNDGGCIRQKPPKSVPNPKSLPALAGIEPDFKQVLRSAKNIEEFKSTIAVLLRKYCIPYFSHQSVICPEYTPDIFGNLPAKFVAEYLKNSFHLSDYQLHRCFRTRSPAPLCQSDLTEYLLASPYISDEMQSNLDLHTTMRKHGIADWCCIYIEDENGPALMRFGLHLSSDSKCHITDNLEALTELGKWITATGYRKFNKEFHNPKYSEHMRLNPKPLSLLRSLKDDLTLNEAASILNLSISTANQHVAYLKRRFGTTTMHGTLIAASKAGFIKF